MQFLACHKIFNGNIQWDKKLNFVVICNDLFYWACADMEDITNEDLPKLEQAVKDTDVETGQILFCCQQRKMRPQGAYYDYIDQKYWHLFDNCGPDRDNEPGNTKKPSVKL